MVTKNSQKSNLGMTKSMNFFQNIIKPFKRNSNRGKISLIYWFLVERLGFVSLTHFFFVDLKGLEDDIERIAAMEQKVFPFQVLVSATKDFHPTHKLGEGGFGPVFKVTSILTYPELKVSIFMVLVVKLYEVYCVCFC